MKCSITLAVCVLSVCSFAAPLHGIGIPHPVPQGTGMPYPMVTGIPALGGAGHAAPSGLRGLAEGHHKNSRDHQNRHIAGIRGISTGISGSPFGGFPSGLTEGTGMPYPIGTATAALAGAGHAAPSGHSILGGAPGNHHKMPRLHARRQFGGLGESSTSHLGSASSGLPGHLPHGTGMPYSVSTATPTDRGQKSDTFHTHRQQRQSRSSGTEGSDIEASGTSPIGSLTSRSPSILGLKSSSSSLGNPKDKRSFDRLGETKTGLPRALSTGYPYGPGLGNSSSSPGGLKDKRQSGSLLSGLEGSGTGFISSLSSGLPLSLGRGSV